MIVTGHLASKGHNLVPCARHDDPCDGFFVRTITVAVGEREIPVRFRSSVDTEVDAGQLRSYAARFALSTARGEADVSAATRALRSQVRLVREEE